MYYIGTIPCDPNYLEHYGIKGQKHGVRRFQNADRTWTEEGKIRYGRGGEPRDPSQLFNKTKKFKYKEFDKLMSPEEVERTGRGSCHDQVMYEMDKLRKMGLNPKATFVMEVTDGGQGGMTHSYVTFKRGNKTYWIEPASTWPDKSGINEFNSSGDVRKAFRDAHKSGEFGNKSSYKNLIFQDFDDRKHTPGETLEEFVEKCLE